MAITYQASSTVASTAGAGPISGTYPAGIATADLAVAFAVGRVDPTTISTATSGWTERAQVDDLATLAQLNAKVYTHPYTSGDAGPAFTISGGTLNDGVYVVTTNLRGHDTTTPLDVAAQVAFGDSATMTAPSVNTVTDGALVCSFFASSNDVTHGTPTNGATLAYNELSNVGGQTAMSLTVKTQATAGATGATSLTQATSARYQWIAVTLAFRPLVAVTGPPARTRGFMGLL